MCQGEVQEVHLTDDLADSLMNPPTDQEVSDEEPPRLSSPTFRTRVEVHEEMEVEEELFLEDQEVQGITNSLQEEADVAHNSVEEKVADEEEESKVVLDNCEVTESVAEVPSRVMEDLRDPPKEVVIEQQEKTDCAKAAEVEVKNKPTVKDKAEAAQPIKSDNVEANKANGKSRQRKTEGRQRKRSWGGKKEKKVVANTNEDKPVTLEEVEKGVSSKPTEDLPKVMSYSSAMKCNLVEKVERVEKVEKVEKSGKEVQRSPPSSHRQEQRNRVTTVRETKAHSQDQEDKWESVPSSVTEPESWEKTPQSKKRKHKKSGQVKFEEPVVEEPPVVAAPTAPEPVSEVAAPKVEEAAAAVDEDAEEAEQEERRKKEGRRRRKKHGSEDPEEGVRRVVICDNQMDQMTSGRVRDLSEVVGPRASTFSDFLIVSELGCGIQRGCMGFGRLYQGKYVPPERTDGLLPQEKIVLEALKVAETEEEGAKEAKKEAEEVVEEVVEAPAADIDLD